MTNLEYFKKKITADSLCDMIYCCACPFCDKKSNGKPCPERLKEWAKKEYKGGK